MNDDVGVDEADGIGRNCWGVGYAEAGGTSPIMYKKRINIVRICG